MTELSRTAPAVEGEWRRNWTMVLAALVGVSFATIPTMTLGMFMEPLQAEFGWTRTQISAGLTVFALANLPLMPLAGVLVDRFGARRVALPGLVLAGLAFAAFGLMRDSLAQWFATWILYTLVSLAVSMPVWTTAVSSAFTGNRGMAIAIVLCGSGLGQALGPVASRWLIDGFGWRVGYVALALAWASVAFVLALFLFHDRSGPRPDAQGQTRPAPSFGGLTVREALRDPTILRIAFATLLMTTLSSAIVVHMVPLLTSLGLTRAQAAAFALVIAAAALAGKLLTGWLADRVSAAVLPAVCYGGPAVVCLMLLFGSSSFPLLVLAIVIQGYCGGAALQLSAYLTTRYAGLHSFGTIYGLISMLMALGGGLGPLIGGVVFDQAGNYLPLLMGGVVVGLVAGLALLGLRRYPEFAAAPAE
jgi:MFS family permease